MALLGCPNPILIGEESHHGPKSRMDIINVQLWKPQHTKWAGGGTPRSGLKKVFEGGLKASIILLLPAKHLPFYF